MGNRRNSTAVVTVTGALCLVASVFTFSSFRPTKGITADYAIKLAEDFISRNGYTDKPIDTSTHKLDMELMDDPAHGLARILKWRKKSLYPKAYFISASKKEWHIGFVSTDVPLLLLKDTSYVSRVTGRAVIVNLDGTEIRMAHKEPIFYYFKRL